MKKLILNLRRKQGFTLIEMIMTIVIVGIVSIPLSLMIFQQVQATFYAEDMATALNLGRYEMERVDNLPFNSVSSATMNNYLGFGYDVVRTVSFVSGGALTTEAMKKVIVEVKKTGTAEVVITLSTYVTKNILYGV